METKALIIKPETIKLYAQAAKKYIDTKKEIPTADKLITEALKKYIN